MGGLTVCIPKIICGNKWQWIIQTPGAFTLTLHAVHPSTLPGVVRFSCRKTIMVLPSSQHSTHLHVSDLTVLLAEAATGEA